MSWPRAKCAVFFLLFVFSCLTLLLAHVISPTNLNTTPIKQECKHFTRDIGTTAEAAFPLFRSKKKKEDYLKQHIRITTKPAKASLPMSNASPSEGFFGSFQSAFGGALNNFVSSSSAVHVTAQSRTAPENSKAPATLENSAKSSDSSAWTPEDEKRRNSFLKALQPGGILEKAALYKRPFNAVFIPRQRILESLQIVDLLEATQQTSSPSLEGTCTLGNDGGRRGEENEDTATPPPPFLPPPASARARHIQHSINGTCSYDEETDRLFDPALLMRIPHDELSCRELLGLLLEHHLALFDSNGLAQSFTLACGVRGSLSETLDKIHISGVKSEIPIFSQIAPTASTSSSTSLICHGHTNEHANEYIPPSTHADSLNIFFLEDTAVEAYELNKYMRRALCAASAQRKSQSDEAQARNAAKQNVVKSGVGIADQKGGVRNERSEKTMPVSSAHQAQKEREGGGGLGKFISNLFGPSSKTIAASEATDSAAETRATLSAFQRFQQKMQRPESRQLARSVTAFIEYCNASTQQNTNAAADEKGHVLRAAKPISSKEVRSVVDQLMSHMRQIKEWEGMDDIAIEGFEKYIMTKIYARAFCFTEEEKCESRRFENRLAAFSQYVSEQTFEIVPNLSERAQWRQATVELAAMGDYKCPRDKLVCGMNACRLLIRAVELATKVHEHNQKVSNQKEEEQKRGLSPHQEGCGTGGKEPLFPNPLPLMGVPPDHPSTPLGAGGYVVVPPQTSAHLQPPSSAGTADVFLPALFLCLAKANPPLFVANVKFIDRYRHRSLLDNESGYLLTCLMSAVEFWQNVTADQLGLAEDTFQHAMEKERALNEKEDWAVIAASQPALAPRQPPKPATGLTSVAQTTCTLYPHGQRAEREKGITSTSTNSLFPLNAGCIIDENRSKNSVVQGAESSYSNHPKSNLLDPFDDFFQQGATRTSQDANKNKDNKDKANVATACNTPSTFSPLPVIGTIVQSGDPKSQLADLETRRSLPAHDAPYATDPCAPKSKNGADGQYSGVVKGAHAHHAHPSASAPLNTSLLLEKAYAKLEANDGSVDTLTIFELRLVAADALRMRRKELEEM